MARVRIRFNYFISSADETTYRSLINTDWDWRCYQYHTKIWKHMSFNWGYITMFPCVNHVRDVNLLLLSPMFINIKADQHLQVENTINKWKQRYNFTFNEKSRIIIQLWRYRYKLNSVDCQFPPLCHTKFTGSSVCFLKWQKQKWNKIIYFAE